MTALVSKLFSAEQTDSSFSLATQRARWGGQRSRPRESVTALAGAAIVVAAAGMLPAQVRATEGHISLQGSGPSKYFVDNRALLIEELRGYESLECGWDGASTDMIPSREAINEAIMFVEGLPPFIALPAPMVSNDGEVGLFWHDDALYLDVGFRGLGQCSFFGKVGIQKYKGRGHIARSSPVPPELLDLFMVTASDRALQL